VLAWLLGEPDGRRAALMLAGADLVTASDLTVLECSRALVRAVALSAIPASRAARLAARLDGTAAHWRLMPISPDILARARRPFPTEPVRSLDAIHLASALELAGALGDVGVLSLDHRVRAAAGGLGLRVVPEQQHGSPGPPRR
jgi:hypothetical protein